MTYNVLAPRLSGPTWFAKSEENVPGSTDATVRWPKVVRYVETAMDAGAVIALQEVEDTWLTMLKEVLLPKGYDYRLRFGAGDKQFMGVMLAWPKERFDGNFIGQDLSELVPDTIDASFLAWQQHTIMLLGILTDIATRQRIAVATCHMPVLWKTVEERRAQTILLNIAVGALQHKARSAPAVLLGDFNFKPDSTQYAMAAGDLEPMPYLIKPMKSAYRQCFGAEPVFTNNAWTEKMTSGFVATLDYIWLGDGVAATECLRLPDKVEGPLPNEREGSDHVPLVAMLDVGSPTGLWPDMPEVGDADIAGTFEGLVKKWKTLTYNWAGKVLRTDHKFEEAWKKNYMKTLSTDDESQSPRSDDQKE